MALSFQDQDASAFAHNQAIASPVKGAGRAVVEAAARHSLHAVEGGYGHWGDGGFGAAGDGRINNSSAQHEPGHADAILPRRTGRGHGQSRAFGAVVDA